jgi:hypothetical protein
MSPDEMEARSRRYSNERIILLPLSSGALAVFNNGGDLCGIIEPPFDEWRYSDLIAMWHPPARTPSRPRPTLEELGL